MKKIAIIVIALIISALSAKGQSYSNREMLFWMNDRMYSPFQFMDLKNIKIYTNFYSSNYEYGRLDIGIGKYYQKDTTISNDTITVTFINGKQPFEYYEESYYYETKYNKEKECFETKCVGGSCY